MVKKGLSQNRNGATGDGSGLHSSPMNKKGLPQYFETAPFIDLDVCSVNP